MEEEDNMNKYDNQTKSHQDLINHFKSVNRKHLVANILMGSTLVLYFALIAIMFWG